MIPSLQRLAGAAETLLVPLGALALALGMFGVALTLLGHDGLRFYDVLYQGAFGTAFSWQNTLQRAAPLMLTALATALPARAGLLVIGGEGALALGGLAAAVTGHALADTGPVLAQSAMALAGMGAGALWLGLAGALRHYRGVNETISSLLLAYIGAALFHHLVEGPLRDPASLNKPSTAPLPEALLVGTIGAGDVHWNLLYGVAACVAAWLLVQHSTAGFAAKVVGGNPRAAQLAGLPVGTVVIASCALGGAAAGLAGMAEVAAVHGAANASLFAGYGYAGILVAFMARHHPLAVLPVAILIGGIGASGGLLQRRLGLPDAAVLLLQGSIFLTILAAEPCYGRLWLPLALTRRRA